MKETNIKRVQTLLRRNRIIRSRELDRAGIQRVVLARMLKRGLIKRVGRGLYVAPDFKPTARHSLAEAGKRYPRGVICLLTALQLHNLTTQAPFEVWMAVERKAWRPVADRPAMRFAHFGGKSYSEGVESYRIEGVEVKVYNPAKTVADCFKYRHKIGLDIALEALRDCLAQHKCPIDELWKYAKICRVQNVMRPYLEALG